MGAARVMVPKEPLSKEERQAMIDALIRERNKLYSPLGPIGATGATGPEPKATTTPNASKR